MSSPRIACSWSGGKDSCLALHMLRQAGMDPAVLLTMFDEAGERSRSHGLRPAVVTAQAKRLDLPLRIGNGSWETYEVNFKKELAALRDAGIDDIAFGDIDLEAHREWEERVCRESGLRAHLPLWGRPRRGILEAFWDAGFRCHIVAADANAVPREIVGAELTPDVASTLEGLGVDACGENGEFHTLVVDGPGFQHPLDIELGEVVTESGYLAVDILVAE